MTSTLARTMRAVVCPKAPIPPSGLVYTTAHPVPAPKAGHVLIRVKAFGLNRSELFTRQGHSPGIQFPRVLGIECVGTVADTGGGARWKEGDAVAAIMGGMGRQFDGGYAEYALVPHASASNPITIPKGMSWADFGAIPETFMTAYGALKTAIRLKEGETLLIRGGTTSVGIAAAALAKSSLFRAGRVLATTRSTAKSGALTAAGVDTVIVDAANSVREKVMVETGGKGADKALELVGGPTIGDTLLSLGPEGIAAYVGCVSGEWIVKDFDPGMSLAPSKYLTMYGSNTCDLETAPLQEIVDAVANGTMSAKTDKVFKIEETGEAHAYMEANAASGKVVCVVD